jgi:hypothetical protein
MKVKTDFEPETKNMKEVDIGIIIAELIKSTYSRKTVTQENIISGEKTENTDCTNDTQIALNDSKANMEIKRKSYIENDGTSPNISNIEEASDSDNDIDVKGKSVSNHSQNEVVDIEKPESNEAHNNNECEISEKKIENFKALFQKYIKGLITFRKI